MWLKIEHIFNLLEKRTKICPNSVCQCEKTLKIIENCEQCKNNIKCEAEYLIMCNDCLYEVLEGESDNWSSGNLQIDEFIRKAQRSLYCTQYLERTPYKFYIRYPERIPYNFYPEYPKRIQYNFYTRYPEWIPYNFLTKIKYIGRGKFGAVLSAEWSQGAKKIQNSGNKHYYIRSDPCAVVLKKFKDMNQLSIVELCFQDLYYCCNLYGITQDPSTSEYMFVEPISLCDNCLRKALKNECSKWSSGYILIDEFIRKAQQSLPYKRYPEWIPYDSFTEIKHIKGESGAVISAKWSQGAKKIQIFNNGLYYIRSDPCEVVLKKLKDMNQISMIEIRHRDSFYCCDLYGITQDPSTSEYMLVEPTSLCNNCHQKALESELIDEFIRKIPWSLPYNLYPEWIPYDSFTEIKHIRDEFGTVISAKWSRRAKRIQSSNDDHYYLRSDPCAVVLKKFMKQILLIEKQFQDRSDCGCLYGITQNPKTLEYMFVEATYLCDCKVLIGKFSNWSSGSLPIDKFIRNAQQSLPYDRYPEWIPYDSFIEIKYVNRGELGAVISAKWSKGTKIIYKSDNERYYIRSDPCAVVLKKFINQSSLLLEKQLQDRSDCCCLYGITQNPLTLEYMIVEHTYLCDSCLHRVLVSEFPNWSSGNLQIDEFIRKAQQSLPYSQYPEWIPYKFLSEIKYIDRGEFGAVISAKWSQGAKKIQNSNNEHYYIRSDPCAVILRKFMKQSLLTEKQLQDRSDCCCLYGITQDSSTLEYMLVEPRCLRDSCLHRVLQSEFSNWTSDNSEIDEFIQKAQLSSSYIQFPEWISYDSLTEIKHIGRGGFLLKNFDKLTLENKLSIAQSICVELQNIHAKGWVHGDLHCENILLLNEEDAFISDFGLCRPINETKMLEKKIYGVIPNIAPEILRLQSPYSQTGDIYSLEELTLDEYKSKKNRDKVDGWENLSLSRELINSHHATITYNTMKWKPDIPIHPNAVYKSRMISIISNRLEISDIPYISL
ncbi:14871_t:CDS:2 [Racocetra fulgida]|uniref:14871_t:CDS:1 n=1 Tax=Racocetra fulgida TaxID=60492 RepID=A0A9N8ZNP1_9GLOM|nr:14871_t:CDS:2 [Racocetra fulgida]